MSHRPQKRNHTSVLPLLLDRITQKEYLLKAMVEEINNPKFERVVVSRCGGIGWCTKVLVSVCFRVPQSEPYVSSTPSTRLTLKIKVSF